MIRDEVEQAFAKAVKEAGLEVEVKVERPQDPSHGDFATNAALAAGNNPRETAEKIAENLRDEHHPFVERAEAAGLGFVNVFLTNKALLAALSEKEGGSWKGKRVMVEFTDPNPFKEFHVGHLYSNVVGESLSRLLEFEGAEVKRVNYQGDVGMHVAKAVWGMKGEDLKELEKLPLADRAHALGQAYARGAEAFENDEKAKEEITALNAKIFAKDEEVSERYEKGRTWSLEAFEEMYERLGTKFDRYYFESKVADRGARLVQEGVRKGVFRESEGAVIFPGEKHGLHDRVFVNSQGLPTYEAKELGLAPAKAEDFAYDLSIIVTGSEVNSYFQVVVKALTELLPNLGKKTRHVSHGMVRLPSGKISSRTGEVPLAEDLLDGVKEKAKEVVSSSDLSPEEKDRVAEQATIGAVKYALLRVSLPRDITFDVEQSLNLEGDSGPYLQYTNARCRSILREGGTGTGRLADSVAPQEETLLRLLSRFQEEADRAASSFAPSVVASFAAKTAQAYNTFYHQHRVLQAETEEQKQFRLFLTDRTAETLETCLSLLGIPAPEKM